MRKKPESPPSIGQVVVFKATHPWAGSLGKCTGKTIRTVAGTIMYEFRLMENPYRVECCYASIGDWKQEPTAGKGRGKK